MSAARDDRAPAPRPVEVLRAASVPAEGLRLSVVVPSYNTAPFVLETLRSLLTQTVADLEVIVVDDGSRDESLAVLGAVRDPRVTCVRQANRGLAGSRNTGIMLARADAIGFCDADDIWYPNKAATHLGVLSAHPEVGLTFSYSAYLAEDGTPTGQLLLSRCQAPSALDLIKRNHVGNGSTVVLRKDVFRLAGLFDETLGSCEDFEMWVRCAACTPFSVRLIPQVLTGYRVRSGSMSTSYDDFVVGYRRALERFRSYVPGLSARAAERSYAECLRITSRKAFSNGQIGLSRALFLDALRHAPELPLRDIRAAGMLLLHLCALPLPAGAQRRLYRGVRSLMRQAFRFSALGTGNAGRRSGGLWAAPPVSLPLRATPATTPTPGLTREGVAS